MEHTSPPAPPTTSSPATPPDPGAMPRYRVGERAPPEVRYKLRLTVSLQSLLEDVTLHDHDQHPLAPPRPRAPIANVQDRPEAVDGQPQSAKGPVFEYIKPQPLTLRLMIDKMGERAFGVLAAFLCLPFLTPIPLPGMSSIFGAALAILGVEIAIRRDRPWLPKKVMDWQLPPRFGAKLIMFVAKIFSPLERVIRPRLLFMQNPVAMTFVGLAIVLDGILLALPFPPFIPLTNAIPAWLALITILGITEEDGVSLLVGTTLTYATVIGGIVAIVLFWDKVSASWQ